MENTKLTTIESYTSKKMRILMNLGSLKLEESSELLQLERQRNRAKKKYKLGKTGKLLKLNICFPHNNNNNKKTK